MCNPAFLAPFLSAGGAATAAGATAAASTAIGAGTFLKVAGGLASGIAGYAESRAQSRALQQQATEERQIGAIESARIRDKFRTQIGQQTAELASRGIRLDSPSALALAELAGREMTFEADAAFSRRGSRATELSAAAKSTRASGVQKFLRGGFSAANDLLTAAPDLWPGFAQ